MFPFRILRCRRKTMKKVIKKIQAFWKKKDVLFKKSMAKEKKTKVIKKIKTRVGIRTKLILGFLILSTIPIVTIGGVSYKGAFNTVEQQMTKSSIQLLQQMKRYLDQNIQSIEQKTMLILTNTEMSNIAIKDSSSYTNDFNKLEDYKKLQEFFQQNILIDSNISQVVFYKSPEDIRIYGSSLLPYDYFQKGKFVESGAYDAIIENPGKAIWLTGLDDNYNYFYIGRSIRSYSKDQPSVFIYVIPAIWLQNTFTSIELGEEVDLFALDSNQMVISHSDKDQVGIPFVGEYEVDSLYEQEQGNFLAEDQKVCYMDLVNEWKLVAEIPMSSILGEIKQVGRMMLVLALFCLVIAIVIASIIAGTISKPVRSLMQLMQEAEEGNLVVEALFKGNNEMGRLSSSFNIMIQNIKGLVMETREALVQVIKHVNVVDQLALESVSSSKQVATAVEAIATGAMDQAKDAEQTTYAINQLGHEVNDMMETMQVITEVTEQTKTIGNDAVNSIEILNAKTTESIQASDKLQEDIRLLEQEAQDIIQVVKVIEAISDQTNLLSLNAAIEAARAGEAGRGFTVVADQVRKLADQSRSSTKMIGEMIEGIQKEIQETKEVVLQGDMIYHQQEIAVEKTENALEDIVQEMNQITKEVDTVNQAIEGVEAIKISTIEAIESIAAIAEESAASTEEVTASGQEQAAAAEELARLAKELKTVVNTLTTFMKRFNIEG